MDTLPDIGRNPDFGLTEEPEFAIDTTDFGDGYVQSRPKGINNIRRVWQPKWTALEEAPAKSLYNFLKARGGVTPFIWPHPDEGNVVIRCSKTKISYDTFNGYTVTATFREHFGS